MSSLVIDRQVFEITIAFREEDYYSYGVSLMYLFDQFPTIDELIDVVRRVSEPIRGIDLERKLHLIGELKKCEKLPDFPNSADHINDFKFGHYSVIMRKHPLYSRFKKSAAVVMPKPPQLQQQTKKSQSQSQSQSKRQVKKQSSAH